MNSGKSTLLLQAAYNYEERGMKTLILKPFIDTKGADRVVSRIGISRRVHHLIKSDENIADILRQYAQISGRPDCIFVDEAQFLTVSQAEQLFWLAVNEDIPVICYGLRTDFKTLPFPAASRLLELAHSIEEIKTICRCGKKAMFNARKINGKFVFSGRQIAIDGQSDIEYESLCPLCYAQEKARAENPQ